MIPIYNDYDIHINELTYMSFTYTLIIRCITFNDKYIISEIIEIIYIILKRYNLININEFTS